MKTRYPALIGMIGALCLAGSALAQPGNTDTNQARITEAQAAEIALKAQPGTIKAQELEKEKGGSGLRYSFDIATANGTTHEVGVDAQSGQILENSVEGANPD